MSDNNEPVPSNDLLKMTSEIVAAYVSRNEAQAENISEIISSVYRALSGLQGPSVQVHEPSQKPAVPIRRSVTPDYIICLEDGKQLKMLKRYLRTNFGMSPEEYRAKWGLKPDYPMVAPNYAKQRSSFAKEIGLGRKGRKGGRSKKRT
jgi:predicted transcriptional regulator